MNTIYNYNLYGPQNKIQVPFKITKILTVAVQNGAPCIWLELDTSIPAADNITIVQLGTNCHVPEGAEYISTTFADFNAYVWHWYKL